MKNSHNHVTKIRFERGFAVKVMVMAVFLGPWASLVVYCKCEDPLDKEHAMNAFVW